MGLQLNGYCCRFSGTGLHQIRILVGMLSRFEGVLFGGGSGIYGFLDLDGSSNIELDQYRELLAESEEVSRPV